MGGLGTGEGSVLVKRWLPPSLTQNVGFELCVLDAARVVSVNHLEEGVDELALNGDLQLGDQVGDLVDGEVAAGVQVEVVKDLLQEGRVLSSQLPNARLNFAQEVGDCLLSDSGVLLLRDLPSRLHHANEVLVAGCAHGQVGVVVNPLLLGHNAVVVALGTIEVVKEVLKDLLTGLAAFEELGVHADVVDATNVVDVELATTVLVHHGERLVDHSLATWGQLVSKAIQMI